MGFLPDGGIGSTLPLIFIEHHRRDSRRKPFSRFSKEFRDVRTLPKGLRAPPDRAPALTRKPLPSGSRCCRARHHLSLSQGRTTPCLTVTEVRRLGCMTASWRLGVCHRRAAAPDRGRPRRRPHRGMLPDVDFARAVPDPGTGRCCRASPISLWGDRAPQAGRSRTPRPELRAALTAVSANASPRPILGKTRPATLAIRASIEASPRPDDASIRIDTPRRLRVARALTSIE